MGKCKKCGCQGFSWNPVSAAQKLFSGSQASVGINYGPANANASIKTMPVQDNKSDQVAYRNCMCGHHENYHS